MADLAFEVNLLWKGTGKEGEGQAQVDKDTTVTYSAPAAMGGKGVGTSPEELLIAAVSSCYSGTLYALLQKEKLSVDEVSIRSVGQVRDYPLNAKFADLTVNPVIYGGDKEYQEEYQRVAERARDKCFIGKTIAGNVEYKVGQVAIVAGKK